MAKIGTARRSRAKKSTSTKSARAKGRKTRGAARGTARKASTSTGRKTTTRARTARKATTARKTTSGRTARTGAKTRTKVRMTQKRAARPAAKKRTARGGLLQTVQPDRVLAAVVGDRPQPRSELTRRIWTYIRKNGLQDNANRRMINSDERLRPVFGGKGQVSMFEMTRLVNNHVTLG